MNQKALLRLLLKIEALVALRSLRRYFQSKTKTPTTVGVASVDSLASIGAKVDVLSFHSYHSSWEQGLDRTETALGFARSLRKPVFNSETGCIARANAFDRTIEMALRNGIGFAVWGENALMFAGNLVHNR
jgi:hypothetical protein